MVNLNEERVKWDIFIKNELRKTKNCPFCGETVKKIKIEHLNDCSLNDCSWMEIRCKCGAMMVGREVDPYSYNSFEQWEQLVIELISAWNTRN